MLPARMSLMLVLALGLAGCNTATEGRSEKLALIDETDALTTGSLPRTAFELEPGVVRWYAERGAALPLHDRLPYCHGYGCEFKTPIAVGPDEEAQVAAIFAKNGGSPEAERHAVDLADQWWEKLAAPQLGGPPDVRGSDMAHAHQLGQTDCLDEATNTTTLLAWLEHKGYLKYHHVQRPESRGMFLYAHATAVMTDKITGIDWIADSWMRDSGDPIDVMPLETWFSLAYVDPVS
ncbi:MAG: hypothetical protein GX458_16160 [Phyllobacteriaceae bacterium]|nr:hypothetical protein [Phyllobacteriaceae bacterium]